MKKKCSAKNVGVLSKNLWSVKDLDARIVGMMKKRVLAPALADSLLQLHKDLMLCESFLGSLHNTKDNIRKTLDLVNLQIGGGVRYLSGFVNVDVFPPADVIWDCRYGLPFGNNRFKFVFSEHFLEHVGFPESAKTVVREIHRVLKPGGALLLGVPDGGKTVKGYVNQKNHFLKTLYDRCYRERRPRTEIYGGIDVINYLFRDQIENPKYTTHRWAYDAVSLKKMLKDAGFRKVVTASFDPRYCNPKRAFYTFYIKAIK